MPRKMFRNPEEAAPLERPGSGSPDDSGVRRRPRVEKKVELDPEYEKEVRHKELQGMVSELVENENKEQAKTKKKNREQIESQVGELLGMEQSRMASEQHRQALQVERADLEQRIKEMGGIWGEESFFVLEDRLAEIRKELGEAAEAKPVALEAVPRQGSPVEFNQGMVKALEKKRKTLDNQQNKVREELKTYGIGSMDQINFELEQMEDEIRAETENKKPSLGYRITKFFRRMAGQDISNEAKEALKKYHELEVQQNANVRDLRSVNEELDKLEGRSGGPIEMSRSGRVYRLGQASNEQESSKKKGATKDVAKQIAELKEAEGSQVESQRERYDALEAEMEGLRAEAVRGGAIPEEFDRLVGKMAKSKDKELMMLVQGYQRKMKEAEALRKELGMDVRPEASLRVTAAKARRAAEEEEEQRFFAEKKPVEQQQQESKDMLKVRGVWEAAADIEDAIKNFEAVKDDMDVLADEAMFHEKQNEFAKRVRALESQGSGTEYDEALQAAEDALARYAVALNRRISRIRKEAATAGAGNARPQSVITTRAGRMGSYGTSEQPSRRVEMSRMSESAPKTELVNKEVGMYRSVEWRKNLLDKINADENWRAFMHGVYEDVSARLKQLSEGGHVYLETLNTPDAALDYALALFRGHARNGKTGDFIRTESDRLMAQEEVKHWDAVFGWGERYKVKDEESAEPLKQEKRSRRGRELRAIEEEVEPIEEEVTLSVEDAQQRFNDVNKELESVGVTSLGEKMNDDVFLKADADLRHAKRVARTETGKRSVKKYKEQKEEPVITISEPTAAEQAEIDAAEEEEQGIPSLQELQALAASPDMESQQPKHEDLVHMDVPKGHIMIEEPTPKAPKSGSKRPSLRATLEERLNAAAAKPAKSKKKRGA